VHPPLPFDITLPESWYSFYFSVDVRRLSWFRACLLCCL